MSTKRLSIGTWKDRDGVRRSHKRGRPPRRVRVRAPSYYETLKKDARDRIAKRYGHAQ